MRDKEVALDVTDLLDAKPQIVSGIPEESLTLLNSNSFQQYARMYSKDDQYQSCTGQQAPANLRNHLTTACCLAMTSR